MRVIHFIPNFSPVSQTFIYDLVKSLDEIEGVNGEVLAFKRMNADERPYGKVRIVKSLDLFEELDFKIRKRLRPAGNTAKPIRRLMKELEYCGGADVLHAHFGPAGYRLIRAFDGDGGFAKKLVVSLHGTDTTKDLYSDAAYRLAMTEAAERGTVFAANSLFLKRKAVEAGLPFESVRVVRNTVNDAFRRRARRFPYGGGALKLIGIGRLVPWKGHEYLVRALPMVIDAVDDATLTIVGDGPERPRLERLAADLGISDRVRLAGSVKHSEIPGMLSEHHIYVQPSIRDYDTKQEESFGVSVLEALTVGLPVVISDSGGMRETVGFETSSATRIVRQRNEYEIAAAILETLEDPDAFDPELASRKEILRRYTRESQLRSLVSIYREIAGRSAA